MRRSFLLTMSALSDNGVGERAGVKLRHELGALAGVATTRASFGLFGLLWAAVLGLALLAGCALLTPLVVGVL